MRHFKDWVFVLLPASQRLNFLAKSTSLEDLQSWIGRLSNLLGDLENVIPHNGTNTADGTFQQSTEELRRELDIVCARAIDNMQSRRSDKIQLTADLYDHENLKFAQALEIVLRATMILENSILVREAMIECRTKISPARWREIGICLDRFTLDKYKHG